MQGNIAGAYLQRVLYQVMDTPICGWSKLCLLQKIEVQDCCDSLQTFYMPPPPNPHTHIFFLYFCISSALFKKKKWFGEGLLSTGLPILFLLQSILRCYLRVQICKPPTLKTYIAPQGSSKNLTLAHLEHRV